MMETEERKSRVYHTKATEDVTDARSFMTTFGKVVEKDSGADSFGFSERINAMECIDMDLWEKSISGQTDKTMDCAIGMSTFDDNARRHSFHRLLLVELKMNCRSRKPTIGSTELAGKVRHSCDMLNGHPIDRAMIFLFPETQRSIYARELYNWQHGSDKKRFKHWKVLNPDQFNNYIGFKEDYPYNPTYKEEMIVQTLLSHIASKDYGELCRALNDWKERLIECQIRYMVEEESHIREVVSKTMRSIFPEISDGDEKEFIEMEFGHIFDFPE